MLITVYLTNVLWYIFNTCCSESKTYQNYKQFYSSKRKLINQVTHHDFVSFETESLSVDFISFNTKQITSH